MTPLALLLVAAVADPFAAYPNVKVIHYDVTGTDAASIQASIEAHGPRHPNEDKRYAAITDVRINWHWTAKGKSCDLKRARINFSSIVKMPRLTTFAMLPPALQAEWTAYVAALAAHEAGHVKLAVEHLPRIRAAVRNATCATANRAGRAALKQLKDRDIAYDIATRHGEATGSNFP
jgi:predicted secreted Zn-dependent protease